MGGKLEVISIKLLVTQERASIHVQLLWVVLAGSHLHKSTLPFQVMDVLDDCYQAGCAWCRITIAHFPNMQLVANYNLIFNTQYYRIQQGD